MIYIIKTMSFLINTTNISNFIKDGGKFIYTNGDYYKYTTQHIKNSIHFPASSLRNTFNYRNSEEIKPVNGIMAIIPVQQIDTKSIEKLFKNARLSINDKICVYDEGDLDILNAFYVIIVMELFGFKNVSYLNFDWHILSQRYITQDYPMWKEICDKNEKYIYNNSQIIKADQVAYLNKINIIKILDVRAENDFSGDSKLFKINGHIPNAKNIHWKTFFELNPKNPNMVTNVLKPLDSIKNIMRINGMTKNSNIVLTCNSGNEITSTYFVIKKLLGWYKIKLFSGSWNVYQYLHQIDPIKYPISQTKNKKSLIK